MPRHLLQHRDDGVAGDAHALGVALPRMRFHQHAEAVAQLEIAVREARRRHPVLEAGGRVVVDHEGGVVGQRQRALPLQVGEHGVAQAQAVAAQRGVAGVQRFHLDRHVVLELRAVGDVQIHIHERVPLLDQAQHRLHLRRVGLDVVAVEVEVLRGGAPAHLFRTTLVWPVPGAEALVPVDVEHRHEQPYLLVQRAARGVAVEQLAQRQEAGVLAVDLAGVDAALDQHYRQLARLRGRRIQCTRGRHRQRLHRPAFRGGAEVEAAHRLRIVLRERSAQRDGFGVAAGARESVALGFGGQARLAGQRRHAAQQHRQQQGGQPGSDHLGTVSGQASMMRAARRLRKHLGRVLAVRFAGTIG
ncbi:hypothetical protein NB706_002150 [Xanthomonas sacchari]|nr:hypothetical protein [Xanthomonas sacchari]